jgi:cohesin complex subunit SA-1/2
MDIDNPPLSSPGGPSSTPAEDRRKSGRQTRRPEVFSQTTHSAEENAASGKRKRGEPREEGDEDASESDSEADAGDETDEEVLKDKRRAARRASGKKPKSKSKVKGSHASKKPKVASNGLGRQLAFRPATNGRLPAARPRKPKVRPSLAAGERGLFGE